MSANDLRGFIKILEGQGQLIRVREELDPRCEVSAVLDHYGQEEGPAIFFERVKGYPIPIFGNIFGSRSRFSTLFETGVNGFLEEYVKRKKRGIAPVEVRDAPVKEVKIGRDVDLRKMLPILTYHEKDVGPYITQGVVFFKASGDWALLYGCPSYAASGK